MNAALVSVSVAFPNVKKLEKKVKSRKNAANISGNSKSEVRLPERSLKIYETVITHTMYTKAVLYTNGMMRMSATDW